MKNLMIQFLTGEAGEAALTAGERFDKFVGWIKANVALTVTICVTAVLVIAVANLFLRNKPKRRR